ncbi:cadherin domain-containing protein [Bradyrhizobium sp. LA7.1]|uniref:cadherin repeat domain-containing protein n=1 Tax=Bradyrhizobium sp. LA7.1 TaxID=3156324 RepID=UPI003393A86C
MLTIGKLSLGDNDGDPTDPDVAEERAEGFTVAGQPIDLSGYFNSVDASVGPQIPPKFQAALAFSVVAAIAGGVGGAIGKVIAAVGIGGEVLFFWANGKELLNFQDPYDPNYHTLYVPITPALPAIPDDPSLPPGFRADAVSFMQAAAQVASLADAVNVTENRLTSANQDGDLAGFLLQDAQLNKLAPLLGQAHSALAQAETVWAADISKAGVNISITPAQFSDFVSQLSAGGVSALPAQEQTILNSFTTDPAQQNAVLQALLSLHVTTGPSDFLSALSLDINANKALAAIYLTPADPNALAGVHQPIISSSPVADTLTENGTTLSDSGTISFLDANSTLSPTASVTVTSVTATGSGLVLADAQKRAFADAFHFTDAKTGAWSFDLSPADSAFLIPGDSVKIVETVTVDDGQGGTVTQDETFTILGSNEPPKITSGGGGNRSGYIVNEDARFITDITATDPDRGDHVTFSIVGANKKTPFTIDAQTGVLSLKHGLDDEKSSTITVRATDSYGASTTQTVHVKVAHDHLMVGTNADDTFVFKPHFGFEIVKNFDPTHDFLQFNNTTFSNAQDVLNDARQVHDDVVITTSHAADGHDIRDDWHNHGHDTIILKDVQLAALHSNDFTIVG